MPKPKQCPKCGATSDEINNAKDMANLLGLDSDNHKKWMCRKCNHFFNNDEAELEACYDGKDFSKMTLSQIADVIIDDWRDISPPARKYVEALMNLGSINDMYGQDSAESIISYFLANAKKWRGPVAREVKKCLRKLLKKN